MRREIGLFVLLGVLCQIVGEVLVAFGVKYVDRQSLSAAVGVCLAASIPPIVARHTSFAKKNHAAMPLVTVGWRTGLLLLSLAVSAATKWPLHISFCLTLLGCYFPFLVLESALSIRRIQIDTRSQG